RPYLTGRVLRMGGFDVHWFLRRARPSAQDGRHKCREPRSHVGPTPAFSCERSNPKMSRAEARDHDYAARQLQRDVRTLVTTFLTPALSRGRPVNRCRARRRATTPAAARRLQREVRPRAWMSHATTRTRRRFEHHWVRRTGAASSAHR